MASPARRRRRRMGEQVAEEPKVEAPKVEAPKVEAPKVEAPKAEPAKPARRRRAPASEK